MFTQLMNGGGRDGTGGKGGMKDGPSGLLCCQLPVQLFFQIVAAQVVPGSVCVLHVEWCLDSAS